MRGRVRGGGDGDGDWRRHKEGFSVHLIQWLRDPVTKVGQGIEHRSNGTNHSYVIGTMDARFQCRLYLNLSDRDAVHGLLGPQDDNDSVNFLHCSHRE